MNHLKRLLPWVKLGLFVIVLGFVFFKLAVSWQTVLEYRHQLQPVWLLTAAGCLLLANVPCVLFWRIVLVQLGQQPPWWQTFRAHYIGHLGKYTPGKAMVVLMRTDMIRGPNVHVGFAAVAVFFETLTMMAVGAFLAAAIVFFYLQGHPKQTELMGLATAVMVVAGLPILPPVFRFIVRKLGIGKNDLNIITTLLRINFRTLAVGWILMTATWIMFGLSLWATMRGVSIDISVDRLPSLLPLFTAAMALSVVLGFVSMIPGGFGVRDSALILLIGAIFVQIAAPLPLEHLENVSPEQATDAAVVLIAALHRGLNILAELFAACVFWPFSTKTG